MNIVTLLGTPHVNGNTATLLKAGEKELETLGHTVERINLRTKSILPCQACYACQREDKLGHCIVEEDDANDLFEAMSRTDAFILAAPLYCWGFPSPVKALFDRGICCVRGFATEEHRSLLDGKIGALLITCAGPVEKNADLVGPMFDRMLAFVKARKGGEFIVPFCTDPESIEDRVKDGAREFVRTMVNSSGHAV